MARPHITLRQIRERTAPKTFARGESIYLNKDISETALRGSTIEGMCEAGSQPEPYTVQATFEGDSIVDTSCNCMYDFGGDCKHVVALLLTYLNSPNSFEARVPLADVLETRDKSELISLIRQMLKRYPDLKHLVDRPVVRKTEPNAPLDTKAYRKELHRAYGKEREWGRPGAEAAVESVRTAALEFAEKEDWRSASSIYRLIIEECLAHVDYFYDDEEGWYAESIDEVIAELDVCLSFLVDDDHERQAILNSLTDFYATEIETGGDVGADVPDIVLKYARRQDAPNLQRRLKTAIDAHDDDPYSDGLIENYKELIAQLDLLDNNDPEAILARLREAKTYDLLIGKLLQFKRVEEALSVIREQMRDPQARAIQLPRLYAAGYPQEAVRLAEETLSQHYEQWTMTWLIDTLQRQGDTEGLFRWQLERMKHEPSVNLYNALKTSAESLGNWSQVRSTIIDQLEKGKYYGLLTSIYMVEELWDKAWMTLPKVSSGNHVWPNLDFKLERDLAEQTLETHPQKALHVLINSAFEMINQRNRDAYTSAAHYLVKIRDTYDSIDEFEEWEKIIAKIRGAKPRLPALMEELKKVGL